MYSISRKCQLLEQSENIDVFINQLAKELPIVLKHEFLAKSQATYLEELKDTIDEEEFIVTLDFSENYSFHIQDAIQSQHWSKDQSTLNVYVVYFKENGVQKHLNFVVFSEYVNHDSTGVHLYNSKMISFLKNKFESKNI